jgi:hypothetical protein
MTCTNFFCQNATKDIVKVNDHVYFVPRNLLYNIFGSAAILLTLGVIYELRCMIPVDLTSYDLVIGECTLAGFKTVKVKPAF